ncbi:SpvB domain-containing protein [Thelonectria olida]|uniref:SpvB domain-containing protein n=1 Tax=Thelonectria olida TaxID=1576542 RepID=A0A9P9AHX9_9HYPO|nr:SpvB domain-containing protein [Thelonectria olida]
MSFNSQEKMNSGTEDAHNRYLDGGTAVLSHRPDLPGQDRGERGRSIGGGVAAGNEGTSKPLLETRIPAAPSLSLPKGGGAIQGIGEKFSVNPSNGTGQLSIPIKVAPGRSGMQPNLSLSYDSGAGNGEFGLGWRMSGPDSITRKTSKGLPQYNDHGSDEDSDVFLLAGSEDLVPLWKRDQAGSIIMDSDGRPAYDETVADGYVVRAYAPRIVTVFNRIERWTSLADREDMHWRVISPENVTAIFGPTESSRIYDISSAAVGTSRRIFSWLQAEVYDSRGNAMTFSYKREDVGNVALTQAHEQNRSDDSRRANLYLKTIRYGNIVPNRDPATWEAFSAFSLPEDGATWKYSVVLDYGEHSAENPTPNDSGYWACRCDPFSRYNSGFEIRTYRLCRRVLVFHHFEELGDTDYLVSSVDFTYQENPTITYLVAVELAGYSGGGASGRPPFRKNLPPVEFEYSYFPSQEDLAALRVEDLEPASMENLPIGLDGTNYQWVDLDGEGVSGILAAYRNSWYYKRNTSPSNYSTASSPVGSQTGDDKLTARLGPLEVVDRGPFSTASALNMQFGDVNGNGKLDLISHVAGQWGYYERDEDETLGWTEFRPFRNFPNIQPDRAVQFIDLTGDGLADIMICEDQVYTWFPSEGSDGYGAPRTSIQSLGETNGPVCVFADTDQSIYLADMSGDGLADVCRVRNGECCYWPHLGYGKFGPQVVFDNAPWPDYSDQFDHSRVRLTDVDGSGTADIVYLRDEGVDIYMNQSGNSFSEKKHISLPSLDNSSVLSTVDLLGNGTQCLVWSSPLPCNAPSPMRYVDIFGNKKPHLLSKVTDNLGSETCVRYAPSTKFYVEDNQSGQPWITRLPFPVQCVESVETIDSISGNRFVANYRYAHGFYDGIEREFRGFARVEQTDTSNFETHTGASPTNAATAWNVPPVRTITWFHTGAYFNNQVMSELLSKEYFGGPESHSSTPGEAVLLQHTIVPPECTEGAQQMEAWRAMKGRVLRVEVYSDDASDRAHIPYSVQETNFTVLPTQTIQDAHLHGVYHVHPRESVSCAYERLREDPRVSHQIVLEVDAFGNVLKDLHIAYGRQPGQSQLEPENAAKQETTMMCYQETDYTNSLEGKHYRNPVPSESRQYEIRGLMPDGQTMRFGYDQLVADSFSAILSIPEVPFEDENSSILPRRRLLRQERMLYRADDLSGILSPGTIESLCLPGAYHTLVFTPGLFSKLFTRQRPDGSVEPLISTAEALDGKGYVDLDRNGSLWTSTATVSYATDPTTSTAREELQQARANFFLPKTCIDPFGNQAHVEYDRYALIPIRSRDPVSNTVSLEMDYRVLQPSKATDANGNISTTAYDAMGEVAGSAVQGKPSDSLGDTLDGFEPDPSQDILDAFLANPTPAVAASLLGNATTRVLYDYHRFRQASSPVYHVTISRETHVNHLPPPGGALFQVSFTYSDGFGRVIQTKSRTNPGPGPGSPDRWIASGWVLYNNKGRPVKQFEPFFDGTGEYQPDVTVGVSPILLYDPLDRVVAVIRPDHAVTKMVFSPWHQQQFDENDNVLLADPRQDPDVGHLFVSIPEEEFQPSWYEARVNGGKGRSEQDAANKTAAHNNTPTTSHFDSLGRPFLVVTSTGSETVTVSTDLDICGNVRVVRDGIGRKSQVSDWDMCQRQIYSATIDSGEAMNFPDGAGQKCMVWNSRGFRFRYEYDKLRRQKRTWWRDSGTLVEVLMSETVYGEEFPLSSGGSPEAHNLRGKIWQIKDQSGLTTNSDYDWNGYPTRSSLSLATSYKEAFNVSSEMVVEGEEFVTMTSFDALHRPIRSVAPDGTIACRVYNQSTLLDRMYVNTKGEMDPQSDPTTWRPIFTDVQYNPKGQVTSILYSNGTQTIRTYDKLLSRLHRLRTTRADGQAVQDLTYTYDTVGNISHIEDAAQQTVFFRNTVVDPSSSYWYDAMYRLLSASGREHLGQTNGQPASSTAPDVSDSKHNGSGDGNAMGRYVETYSYDLVGNLLSLRHEGSDSQNPGWTRLYSYNEPSPLEPGKMSNRLSQTSVGSTVETYGYDGSAGLTGNMTSMTHLPLMVWDFADRLKVTSKQRVVSGGEQVPEMTHYVYNEQGQRVRKVTESQTGPNSQPMPVRLQERIYLGDYEIFRKYSGGNNGAGGHPPTPSLERTTYHASTEYGHMADICTRTVGGDMGVQHQLRFQLHNLLGSVTLELDDVGALLSYEEFFPFGSSSFRAMRGQTDVAKRFRFTGKELDDENGLYYYGARYYAAWLGRWTATDPVVGPGSRYRYVSNNPVCLIDPDGRRDLKPDPKHVDPMQVFRDEAPEAEKASSMAEWLSTRDTSTTKATFRAIAQYAAFHPDKRMEIREADLEKMIRDKETMKAFTDPGDIKTGQASAYPWNLPTKWEGWVEDVTKNTVAIIKGIDQAEQPLVAARKHHALIVGLTAAFGELKWRSNDVEGPNVGAFQQSRKGTEKGTYEDTPAQVQEFLTEYIGNKVRAPWPEMPVEIAAWYIQGAEHSKGFRKLWEENNDKKVKELFDTPIKVKFKGKIIETTKGTYLEGYRHGIAGSLAITRLFLTFKVEWNKDPSKQTTTQKPK